MIEKKEETSLLLLGKRPQTIGDIWQDCRCSSLLPGLTVPTTVVAGTPMHAYVPAAPSLHLFALDR